MTDEAMSPLRRRMIEDMTIRKFAPKTQHDYLQRVKNFAAFLGRSPDTASFEDVRRYQLHLTTSGVGVPTVNQTVSTLRFFFRVTLKRHDILEHTHFIHEPRKLPVVLSPEEVARLLDAAPGLKYKAALSVAYGAGLRAGEVVSLKINRHRQRADGHPRRAGQGAQGSLRDALTASARAAARLVEGGATAGLAVSRPRPGAANDDAPAQSRLPCRRADGRDQQACLASHVAAQLCDASARAEHRCPCDPGAGRPPISSCTIWKASDGNTDLPSGPASSVGPASRSSTMILGARAAACAGRASSAWWPRSAMAASGRFWRSRCHVSPATAATGIR